ncbi:tRNA (adenosine(37)-N6)-threonylcarbamoyltransferase complex dimerization subunit type 1 TsaB [Sphingosinicella ginsenosidimutans]|uniref:tRNA (Adenosine(37)-N6)-threonylcarbamoyltransferase complex dimerization subunit type 1 TsaB n=1 Tax=Allosphingosinicella ginsenosidimutans TaxID=1176539 RepID=A0A5C6TSA0_9SPHN|nr:tRNA (adenosine(37)-N6)-threonylcarbamoyltransferase complex dimerization subunit type 1 TsaB [Sphingosinicella ginsenosidimutans]TXC63070.1 tRNA (adenosine(37)-N6)-threonylcarbamoyltransferase complex dimerization subunit type 1 TsaB [Sphingosinicella ginsenosidimutans]
MLLVIESATAACSAALLDADGSVLDERHEIVGRGHAERLAPMVAELVGTRRPDAILVDCGPGSFTGVRVGLALAHGLAIGWGAELAGYSSLALLAAAAGAGSASAALQAGHGELFVQDYGGDPLVPLGDLRSLPPDEAARAAQTDLVVGSGAEALVAARGWGDARDLLPRAADVRLLPPALRALVPRPIYGRAPDAKPASGAAGPIR